MKINLAKAAFAHAKATLEKTLKLSLKVVQQEIKVAQNAVDRAHWQKLEVESKGVTDDLLDTFAGAGKAVSRDLGNFKSLAKVLAASAEGVKDWSPGHNKKAMQSKLTAIAHSKYLQKAIITQLNTTHTLTKKIIKQAMHAEELYEKIVFAQRKHKLELE
jgi:hypothetical protein